MTSPPSSERAAPLSDARLAEIRANALGASVRDVELLLAEVERLQREADSAQELYAARDLAWRTEVYQLREALRDIERYPVGDNGYQDIAREALGGRSL